MNWRGLIIGAITLVVGLIVLALLNREQTGQNLPLAAVTEAEQDNHSDYYMEGVISRQFDSNGTLSHILMSPRIDHFQRLKRSQMQQPRIHLVRDGGAPWEVTAALATAEHSSETLILQDHVSLSRAKLDDVAAMQMETEQLSIDMKARTAETANEIRFTSPGGTITATGLRANLATEQLELLANVKGHYEQPTP